MAKISKGDRVRALADIRRPQGGPRGDIMIPVGSEGEIVTLNEHPSDRLNIGVIFDPYPDAWGRRGVPAGNYIQWTGRDARDDFERDVEVLSSGSSKDELAKVRVEITYVDGSTRRETYTVEAPNDRVAEVRGLQRAQREALNADEAIVFDVTSVTWPALVHNPSVPTDLRVQMIATRLARGET